MRRSHCLAGRMRDLMSKRAYGMSVWAPRPFFQSSLPALSVSCLSATRSFDPALRVLLRPEGLGNLQAQGGGQSRAIGAAQNGSAQHRSSPRDLWVLRATPPT